MLNPGVVIQRCPVKVMFGPDTYLLNLIPDCLVEAVTVDPHGIVSITPYGLRSGW